MRPCVVWVHLLCWLVWGHLTSTGCLTVGIITCFNVLYMLRYSLFLVENNFLYGFLFVYLFLFFVCFNGVTWFLHADACIALVVLVGIVFACLLVHGTICFSGNYLSTFLSFVFLDCCYVLGGRWLHNFFSLHLYDVISFLSSSKILYFAYLLLITTLMSLIGD